MIDLNEVEYQIEYQGRKMRRAPDGKRWLIAPARGAADATLGYEDTQSQFTTLEAARDYLDEAVESGR